MKKIEQKSVYFLPRIRPLSLRSPAIYGSSCTALSISSSDAEAVLTLV